MSSIDFDSDCEEPIIIGVGTPSDDKETAVDQKPDQPASATFPTFPLSGAAKVEAGAICEIKDLYKGHDNCPCCIQWSVEPQKKVSTTTATGTGAYAILARKTEGHGDLGQERKLHSIVIQSELIRKVLEKVLKGYPGVTPGLEELSVEAPFGCFYHRWTELTEAFKASTGETTKHLALLLTLLEEEFEVTMKAVTDMLKNNVIEHRYLWAAFMPGELIHIKTSDTNGQDAAMKMLDGNPYDETLNGGSKGWAVTCKHIDYNGFITGFGTTRVKIPEFKGTISLMDLPIVPLRFHPDKLDLEKRLLAQGKHFAELRNGAFQQYQGRATQVNDRDKTSMEVQVSGRVMVDPYAYWEFNQYRNEMRPLRPLGAPDPVIVPNVYVPHPGPPPRRPGGPRHGRHPPPPLPYLEPAPIYYNESRGGRKKGRPSPAEQTELNEEQLMICLPFIRGYSFKSKEWLLLNIEDLSPIVWMEGLIDNLVLPSEEKDLLMALTRSHSKHTSSFDDFVIGKGRGMIILLDGPPGVGKTLTAETVAETLRVPLYTMSAGELGTASNNVERKLEEILEMATLWNAILLLDEAEIFMEERSPYDLERNEMVSIFLRHLEYFKGIMILTTNRVQSMDLAFDSRIDIRVHYPELDIPARRKVWANFIKKLPQGSSIKEDKTQVKGMGVRSLLRAKDGKEGDGEWDQDEALDRLAKLELNGRQIKSVVKTAALLAQERGEHVGMEHVRCVVRITRGIVL